MSEARIIQSSPVAYKDIDLSWMVGCAVTKVSFLEPTPWRFTVGPDATISIQCLWRFIKNGRIVLSSEDHGHKFGLPAPIDAVAMGMALLAGQSITAVQLLESTADILIDFTGDIRLEIIPTSAGYENWELHDPSGTSYVAQGGGQISRWKS